MDVLVFHFWRVLFAKVEVLEEFVHIIRLELLKIAWYIKSRIGSDRFHLYDWILLDLTGDIILVEQRRQVIEVTIVLKLSKIRIEKFTVIWVYKLVCKLQFFIFLFACILKQLK